MFYFLVNLCPIPTTLALCPHCLKQKDHAGQRTGLTQPHRKCNIGPKSSFKARAHWPRENILGDTAVGRGELTRGCQERPGVATGMCTDTKGHTHDTRRPMNTDIDV